MYGSKAQDTTGLKEVEMEYVALKKSFCFGTKKSKIETFINQVMNIYIGNVNHGGAVLGTMDNVPLKEQKILS